MNAVNCFVRQTLFMITGYPEFLLNSTKLDDFYRDLNIKSTHYFMNNFQLERHSFRKALIKVGQPLDRTELVFSKEFDTLCAYIISLFIHD